MASLLNRVIFVGALTAFSVITVGDMVTRLTNTKWFLLPTEDGSTLGTGICMAFLACAWWAVLSSTPRRRRRKRTQ